MRLYVDLETLQLIEGPGFRNPVSSLRFKRGDAAQLEVTFLTNGTTPATIGDPATLELQFGIKPRGRYDVGYLVHESAWTLPAPEAESPSYLCSPSFNTNELDSAMQVGSSTGSELSEITLMGEITWREGAGEPTSTRTFLVVVDNDVNRGTEGVPTDATPAYPSPADLALLSQIVRIDTSQSLSEAEKTLALQNLGLHGQQDEGIFIGDHGLAVGNLAMFLGSGTAVGSLSYAGDGAVAIGRGSTCYSGGVNIGNGSFSQYGSLALGNGAAADGYYCIAIGHGAAAGNLTHGLGRLEIAPNGSHGPRVSGYAWGGAKVLQFSCAYMHGWSPSDGGYGFNQVPGSLPRGMVMFSFDATNGHGGAIVAHYNDNGTIKSATLPLS